MTLAERPLRDGAHPDGSSRRDFFGDLIARARDFPPTPVAVVYPVTEVALSGALLAARQGLVDPVLVGPEAVIRATAAAASLDLGSAAFVEAGDEEDAARKASRSARAAARAPS